MTETTNIEAAQTSGPIVADMRDAFFTSRADEPDARHGLTLRDLGEAILVWTAVNGRVALSDVAASFKVSEALAAQVINGHPWMSIEDGYVIGVAY